MRYNIEGREYEIYEAASGDFLVSVWAYGKDREDYFCGTYTAALEFVLEDSRIEEEPE